MTTNSTSSADATPFAIRVSLLNKRYRLYQKPVYRLLDLFGMCPSTPAYYSEHEALKNVDLSIARGEKVAIIGRNGAGKSTLLKAINGLVRPSSGVIEVSGQVSNLLQIGSGFHPDFTGRQNVYASLAHQGIIGGTADRIFDEIVAFAEIHEYIDQPMKTYSTGMCSRLMFSSSVVTKPEILIVDEILGVGDAYFAHKSFERMRELCTQGGTTLLLVTHDIYSALTLCDRFIWIDRGQVKFDGDGKSAIALYESSVKEQEEHWLRQQNAAKLAAHGEQDRTIVHVLVRSRTGFAFRLPFAIDSIELRFTDGTTSALSVADGAPGWDLVAEGNLGAAEHIGGRRCRAIRTSGSIYHKAEWVVALKPGLRIEAATVRWNSASDESADFRLFTADRHVLVSGNLNRTAGWEERTFAAAAGASTDLDLAPQADYGSGLVRITGVQFLDGAGKDTVEVRHGAPLTVKIGLQIEPALGESDVLFVLGFAHPGTPYSALIYRERLTLPRAGVADIVVEIESLRLGSGTWYVNVGVGEPGLYDKPAVKYFSIDPSWYHVLAARVEFKVTSTSKFDASGCFVVHPATVTLRAAAQDEPAFDSTSSASL